LPRPYSHTTYTLTETVCSTVTQFIVGTIGLREVVHAILLVLVHSAYGMHL